MTARHSGKAGDIIFSLPVVEALGIDVLYVPERTGECEHLYSSIKDLLLQQPYLKEVREYTSDLPYGVLDPGVLVDIDLDRHREHPNRGGTDMVTRYMDVFEIHVDYGSWLCVSGIAEITPPNSFNLVHVTQRFRPTRSVNWNLIRSLHNAYFIGTVEEWDTFLKEFNIDENELPLLRVNNLLEFAQLVQESEAIYCNQSVGLAIAQGLGHPYYAELKEGKTNCLFNTKNVVVL